AKLDLRSGAERILYALLIVFVATITGWLCAYAFDFWPAQFVPVQLSPALKLVFRLAASFVAVFGFSIMFNSAPRMAAAAGVIGMAANILRLELLDYTKIPFAVAAFLAALTAGLLASASKKIMGFPRLTITVPSIVIMVPGLFMYRGIYFLALENVSEGALWLLKATLTVAALSLGLIAARVLTDTNFRHNS
ncbi:MAG: threonine/serine exporter family protein, partial [Treponema sp.]|nr:threonine/serine exporter family protein [Treponema sp.]